MNNSLKLHSDLNTDKIGNLLIYITDSIHRIHKQNVYLTKILKLIYLIDEKSVESTGVPITWLEYKVWQAGPVSIDIYEEINVNSDKYNFFVEGIKDSLGTKITSVNKFDDSEFSDFEISLIDDIINNYGHLTSPELVELLHKENTLWYSIVEKENLKDYFLQAAKTDITINLSDKIIFDKHKLEIFNNAKASMHI